MDKHKQNIEENAIDTLEEGIKKFSKAIEGDDNKAYKFAILHLSNYLELLFKIYIQGKHYLFVFKNPFIENLKTSKARTITFWDSVNFIENENQFSSIDKGDLKFIKDIRNKIEHFEFDFEPEKIQRTFLRIFEALENFPNFKSHLGKLSGYLTNDSFRKIMDEYGEKFKQAKEQVDKAYNEFRENTDSEHLFFKLLCSKCKYPMLITNNDSGTGFECTYCQNQNIENPSCSSCGCSVSVVPLVNTVIADKLIEKRCYPTCSEDKGFEIING